LTLALVAAFVVLERVDGSAVVPRPGGVLDSNAGPFLALLAAAFAVYLGALVLVRRGSRFAHVFVLACAIQLAPLAGPVFMSSDAWTYWSYARVHDPYTNTPLDDRVAARYAGTAYLQETSPYGPAFSLVSRPAGLTSNAALAAWLFRAGAALCVLATTWLVARRRAFAAALVGWNPLVALEFGGGGHNDALMMALVAAALALGERKRVQAAGAAWALAVLVKWVPLILLPLRALEARASGRRVGHLGFAATVVATLGLATLLWRFHWLHAVTPLTHDAQRQTHYALPHRFGVPAWTFLIGYCAAYVWLLREAARGRARLGLALGLLLLSLPYLIAWYVIWPLALAAWDDDDAATVLSLALCAYLLPQRLT
jgi:Glycosyltransferase family 87